MITWITPNVAIGEYTDAINKELLEKEQIDCILSLRGGGLESGSMFEEQICKSVKIQLFRVPVNDIYWSKDRDQSDVKIMLRTAIYMLEELTEKYKRILVHCTSGIDRAPFVVAYWLSDKIDWALDLDTNFDFNIRKAYFFIKKKRPQIMEHWEWI